MERVGRQVESGECRHNYRSPRRGLCFGPAILERVVAAVLYSEMRASIGLSPCIFERSIRLLPRASRATIGRRLQDQMKLRDFVIGETFWTHAGTFRCTDIGARVVVAVKLGPREIVRAEKVDEEVRITKRSDDGPSWLNGPPYAVEELVFDESEMLGCCRTEAELLADGEGD